MINIEEIIKMLEKDEPFVERMYINTHALVWYATHLDILNEYKECTLEQVYDAYIAIDINSEDDDTLLRKALLHSHIDDLLARINRKMKDKHKI